MNIWSRGDQNKPEMEKIQFISFLGKKESQLHTFSFGTSATAEGLFGSTPG